MLTLDDAIGGIFQREGDSFTNDPQDEPTKYGVTLRTYQGCHPSATIDDIRTLTIDQARAFYQWYLAPFAHLSVSDRIWLNILDAVTLHGQHGAVDAVQRAVGVQVDGMFGTVTIGAVMAMPEPVFLVAFAKARLRIMRDDICRQLTAKYGSAAVNATDVKYLGGWQDRVLDVAFSIGKDYGAPFPTR